MFVKRNRLIRVVMRQKFRLVGSNTDGEVKLLFSELYRIIRIARLSSHLFIVSEYMNREMKYLMGLTFFFQQPLSRTLCVTSMPDSFVANCT